MNSLAKKFSVLALLLITVLSINGCISAGSSPQAHFYTLSSVNDKESSGVDALLLKGKAIGIGPLKLPAYLDRPQIVTRGKDNELVLAEFSRWAEPLEDAIPRVVAQNLMNIFPQSKILIFPWGYYEPVKYQVAIEVINIDATLQNEVKLCINWTALHAQNKEVFLSKSSIFSLKINKANYNSLVETLNQGFYDFSLEVAKAIAAEVSSASASENKAKTAN